MPITTFVNLQGIYSLFVYFPPPSFSQNKIFFKKYTGYVAPYILYYYLYIAIPH